MPSQPMIDFASIDLDHVVADKDAIYRVLKQSGTFGLLDVVCHFDPEANLVVGKKAVRGDDWWAPDHIPSRPIFPGALMIETGAQLCSWDFLERRDDPEDIFLGFGGLNGTRFRGLVEPDCEMVFAGQVLRIRRNMFTYAVQGFVEERLVFEMEVMGVVV